MKFIDDQQFMELLQNGFLTDEVLPKSLTFIEDQLLTTVNGKDILLDIYYREKSPVLDRPAVIFLHGGGFWSGDKRQFWRQAAFLALKYNIFAISVNYRLSGDAPFPAALSDVKCVIRWVRSMGSTYHIHPQKIALMGGSPGGHLAALAGVTNGVQAYEGGGGYDDFASNVNLAIIFNGILDFFSYLETAPSEKNYVRQYLGGTPEEIPEIYREASPLLRVGPAAPPMLLLHGKDDLVIPWGKSAQMAEKLNKQGISSEIEIYEGKGHGWFNQLPDVMKTLKRIEPFIVRQFCLYKEGQQWL
ncbi:MAG TPA: alpha/beta hydrolase [Firmicutes bacterium]|jgi:acetyl esterase/lipase|nr:alpha/beta hydrolase [Bacillota bacterium]